jgi:hypothetical protein
MKEEGILGYGESVKEGRAVEHEVSKGSADMVYHRCPYLRQLRHLDQRYGYSLKKVTER